MDSRLAHVRGSVGGSRRYGHEPKVHYRKDAHETGRGDSLCGRCYYSEPTNDPVTCKICLRIAHGA